MKKINFKGRKHAVTATCMLVGMFVLTSSVYANYDNAKGYTSYKDAVKQLAFYEENFSTTADVTISIDGKVFGSAQATLLLDGENQFTKTTSMETDGEEYVLEQTLIGDKSYSYYPDRNAYFEGQAYGTIHSGMDMDDATTKKAVRFMELFADTMVGDLKNNFVLASSEDGNKNYSVNVSGSQIPEVVNAGLSFMFTAANSSAYSNDNYVTYENYDSAFKLFYEEQTGKEMTISIDEAWDEEMEQINEDFYDTYQAVLDSKGDKGIVYVKADGSYEHYDTYTEYMENAEVNSIASQDLMKSLGNDPYIDSAICDFTLDKEGNLVANEMSASMTGLDSNGEKHTITMKINLKVFDYGTTVVEAFDATGKEKLS